jgi:hypothetical protein
MQRFSLRAIACITLLAALALFQQQIQAQSSAPTGRPAGQQLTAYLPMLLAVGVPNPAPPPPPPPPASSGFFALTDYLTYNAATAIDAQGVVHLAFFTSDERHRDAPLGQPAFYTSCAAGAAACADPQHWASLVQIDSAVNEVQIAVTSDGRPRLLLRLNGARGYDYHYWGCEGQCGNADQWAGAYITNAAGVELRNADLPQHSFALDAQDRPRFVYGNSWGNGRTHGIYYAFCDAADCTDPAGWQEALLETMQNKTISADYTALAFDGDQPRFVTRVTVSGLADRLAYFACDQGCDDPTSWASTALQHPEGRQWANWDLALDAAGKPRVALYDMPAPDIFVGGKLYYGWCTASCAAPDAPFQIVQVASGEGMNVDLAIDAQGRTHMVYDAGQRGTLGEVWCDTNCTSAGAWQRRILETSAQLMQEFAPASPFTCDQQERAWLDAIPSVAFSPAGQLVVAYDTKNVAICYFTDPTDPSKPPSTRVERIWWGVRWASFGRA